MYILNPDTFTAEDDGNYILHAEPDSYRNYTLFVMRFIGVQHEAMRICTVWCDRAYIFEVIGGEWDGLLVPIVPDAAKRLAFFDTLPIVPLIALSNFAKHEIGCPLRVQMKAVTP